MRLSMNTEGAMLCRAIVARAETFASLFVCESAGLVMI